VNLAIVADLFSALAQATSQPAPGAAAPAGKPPWADFISSPMSLMLVVLALLWIFMLTSKRKQDRQKKDLLGNIKRGDRVQTIGGIIGKVVEAEEAKVLLKVDESSNTKIWFSRSAIFKVLGEEKAVEVPSK
jgi:preprotein translocase subunit YajC